MNRPKEIGLKFRQLFYVIGIIGVYELYIKIGDQVQ